MSIHAWLPLCSCSIAWHSQTSDPVATKPTPRSFMDFPWAAPDNKARFAASQKFTSQPRFVHHSTSPSPPTHKTKKIRENKTTIHTNTTKTRAPLGKGQKHPDELPLRMWLCHLGWAMHSRSLAGCPILARPRGPR